MSDYRLPTCTALDPYDARRFSRNKARLEITVIRDGEYVVRRGIVKSAKPKTVLVGPFVYLYHEIKSYRELV